MISYGYFKVLIIQCCITLFVAFEPDGIECSFRLSTCGHILGEQWVHINLGKHNTVYYFDYFKYFMS